MKRLASHQAFCTALPELVLEGPGGDVIPVPPPEPGRLLLRCLPLEGRCEEVLSVELFFRR